MKHWSEGVLALLVVALLGWVFGLYGDAAGPETTTTTSAPVDTEAAARGALVADAQGCLLCHSADGAASTAPTFRGLAGSNRPLTTGEFVRADDTYLRTSILDPSAQIVQGYEPIMPTNFADTLTEQQVTDLIAYIASLGA